MAALTSKSKDYLDHRVFTDLKSLIYFYESLSFSVIPFVSSGTDVTICNIDTYVLSAAQGTLASIEQVLGNGRINDSYALLRKYYDTVVVNIYTNIFLQEAFGIDNLVVEEINDWLKGRKQLPKLKEMLKYILKAKCMQTTGKLLNADDRYLKLRNRCNDHTHFNLFQYLFLNDPSIQLFRKPEHFDQFSADLRDIFVLHIAGLFSVNDVYLMASDYRDYLECGMTPEPGSEYWVATFVQEVFDSLVKKHRPDVAELIMKDTSLDLQ